MRQTEIQSVGEGRGRGERERERKEGRKEEKRSLINRSIRVNNITRLYRELYKIFTKRKIY